MEYERIYKRICDYVNIKKKLWSVGLQLCNPCRNKINVLLWKQQHFWKNVWSLPMCTCACEVLWGTHVSPACLIVTLCRHAHIAFCLFYDFNRVFSLYSEKRRRRRFTVIHKHLQEISICQGNSAYTTPLLFLLSSF